MSRANLFGMDPRTHARISRAADQRMRDYQPPPDPIVWEPPPGLRETLDGFIHGVVSDDPFLIQCDGCGGVSTALRDVLHYRDQSRDPRRLCGACRERAGWEER